MDYDASMETYFILANHDLEMNIILTYEVYSFGEEESAWYDLEEANYALPDGEEARLYSVQVDPNLSQEEWDALFHEMVVEGIEESGGTRLGMSQ